MFDDSCNLYSSASLEDHYRQLIEKLKGNSDFELMHLLQANVFSLLQEDQLLNNSLLVDKKTYPDCEPRSNSFYLNEDLHCSDELADYSDTYEFEHLVPLTTYQFRVEVVNAFGKSDSLLTEPLDVPFPLQPIRERDDDDDAAAGVESTARFYSLECATPLVVPSSSGGAAAFKLAFKWFKNNVAIEDTDPNYERRLKSSQAGLASELVFRQSALAHTAPHGAVYTCSLVFTDDNVVVARNESFVVKIKGRQSKHQSIYIRNNSAYISVNLIRDSCPKLVRSTRCRVSRR